MGAKVYKAVLSKEGSEDTTVVAVKVMNVQQSRPRASQDGSMQPPKWLEREVKTSCVQHHENLIQVIGSSLESLPYVIVLEYCWGGSLHELISGDPCKTLERFGWPQRLKAALD